MVKNKKILAKFEIKYLKGKHDSYAQRLKIFDSLLKEARHLKKIPLRDPLEGVDSCLKIAQIVNSLK